MEFGRRLRLQRKHPGCHGPPLACQSHLHYRRSRNGYIDRPTNACICKRRLPLWEQSGPDRRRRTSQDATSAGKQCPFRIALAKTVTCVSSRKNSRGRPLLMHDAATGKCALLSRYSISTCSTISVPGEYGPTSEWIVLRLGSRVGPWAW